MQSQQKKVKWSRGETADALEERTDTGITQVSVSKLENIVADIYGNISRRPALKLVTPLYDGNASPVALQSDSSLTIPDTTLAPFTFVFTIKDNEYVIFVVGNRKIQGFLIRNQSFISMVDIIDPTTGEPPVIQVSFGRGASFAQSNNWGVLSNVISSNYTAVLRCDPSTYSFTFEKFNFSAPWYAPNGTQTFQISSSEITGLNFQANSIGQYTYTEENGETTVYSWIKTGLSSSGITCTWDGPTTTYYLCSIDGGNTSFITTTQQGITYVSWTMTNGNTYTSNQTLATVGTYNLPVKLYLSESRGYFDYVSVAQLDITSNINIPQIPMESVIPAGSIVQFPNNGAYMRVEGYDSDGAHLRMYGSFLTPVADDTATDSIVKVETGYVSLQQYVPKGFVFSQQRLYATKWTAMYSWLQEELPGYVVASQIGRFTDFKNDYNLQSEAVVIDINTQYQEKVNFIADYNGVKIFTTDSEYAYSAQNGVVKQSTNGSSAKVIPAVLGSTLLYVDKTEKQLRALQYEFQTDVFQSNVLNQMCQTDLINHPISLSTMYDKENHTGSFIYMVQTPYNPRASYEPVESGDIWENKVPMAVCNFVPGNQAEIWSRWTVPTLPISSYQGYANLIQPTVVNSITVNNKTWFVILGLGWARGNNHGSTGYSLAELDYNAVLDFEVEAQPTDTRFSALRGDIVPMISLMAWNNGALLQTVFTEYGQTPQVDDPVYNRYGIQIGIVTAVDTGSTPNNITVLRASTGTSFVYLRKESSDRVITDLTFPGATVSVFDGDIYKWDDTLDSNGNYTRSLADLEHPRVGFMINATLESHPMDIEGKTYTEKKRIGKAVAVIRNTNSGAFTVCDKTGYTSKDKKTVNFYGCTGMKDLVRYTIKNIQGAKFTIESLTMIIEYGTLDS